MAKNRKPRVTTKCPAESYNRHSLSRIVEFSNGERTTCRYAGGLICLTNLNPDGHKCLVEVYGADPGVAVRCDPDLLDLSEADALQFVRRVLPHLLEGRTDAPEA